MQSYIVNPPSPPVQPTIKQMLPCNDGTVDPRIVQQMMLAMARGTETPMSNTDAVNIVITSPGDEPVVAYTDAYMQSGDAFADSALGQAIMQPSQYVVDPEARGNYVAQRAPNILSGALMNARDPNMVGNEYVVQAQPPRYVI